MPQPGNNNRDDEVPNVTVDISGLGVVIEFAAALERIKQMFERGEIETAAEYHDLIQMARTEWELHK